LAILLRELTSALYSWAVGVKPIIDMFMLIARKNDILNTKLPFVNQGQGCLKAAR
jgi:hypothetical protein